MLSADALRTGHVKPGSVDQDAGVKRRFGELQADKFYLCLKPTTGFATEKVRRDSGDIETKRTKVAPAAFKGATDMAKKESSAAPVRSAADVAKAWKTVEADIARERKNHDKKGETFIGITKEEFERKMKRADSPIFTGSGWSNTAPWGGTINYSVTVLNPDPVTWGNLAVAIAIGNRNAIVDNDEFMAGFDARFATYAKPATLGFSLAPAASTTQTFAIKIPNGVEKTGYFANAVLQQLSYLDTGKYLDRTVCFFEVV